MKPAKCLHLFVNAADPDLNEPHPGIERWVCLWCGVEENADAA